MDLDLVTTGFDVSHVVDVHRTVLDPTSFPPIH